MKVKEKKGRWKRWALLTLLFMNLLAATLLACSYLAPWISPESFWPLAFLGLAYYYLLLANLGFVVIWLALRKKKALISLITVLLGWNNLGHLVRMNSAESADSTGTIKVLSWNVRLFDLYNWSRNRQTRNRIFEFMRKESADILCIQEFYDNPVEFPVLDTLKALQRAGHVHAEFTLQIKGQNFGIATFSAFPIVGKGFIDFEEKTNNSCIYTDVAYGKDTLRIYNLHLQSNTLSDEDIRFLEALGTDKEVDELAGSGKIFRKLKRGFVKRSAQAERVAAHIASSPYPVVVCGDLNDSPFSYTYRTIRRDLDDAFENAGSGVGKTYNGKFPSFRIDYIFHGEEFETTEFRTVPVELSDHYPVSCRIRRIKDP